VKEAIGFSIETDSYNAALLPNDLYRLARACGDLVIIDQDTEVVQLAHYTVQEYLLGLRTSKETQFKELATQPEYLVAGLCLKYLTFPDFERQVVKPHRDLGTEFGKAGKALIDSTLPKPLQKTTRLVSHFRGGLSTAPVEIDYRAYIEPNRKNDHLDKKFALIRYIIDNWPYHTSQLSITPKDSTPLKLLKEVALHLQRPFEFRPWLGPGYHDSHDLRVNFVSFAIRINHVPLLQTILQSVPSTGQNTGNHQRKAEKIPVSPDQEQYYAFDQMAERLTAELVHVAIEKFGDRNLVYTEGLYITELPFPYQRLFQDILVAAASSNIDALMMFLCECALPPTFSRRLIHFILLEAVSNSWMNIAVAICSNSWYLRLFHPVCP
jgi:hypothetical protein